MFGRMTRTMLPVHTNLLNPKDSALVKQNQILRDNRKAWYYNQHARDLEHLAEGQTVRMRPLVNNKGNWEKGTVLRRLDEISYEIVAGSNVFRRNRVDVKPTSEDSITEARENTEPNSQESNPQIPNENDALEQPTQDEPKPTLRRSTRERTVPKYFKEYVT